ncbi:hypothetical protein pdam_00002091 [Pocillopora damicornis]|uniref:Uncharacterized protein n=1 Tax=Pocillopora damicornis TaxID=46731 RepID=A0A3M6U1I9_POCDA|nr:hypothetical protein pdam_00002091 [Pocillopora damicornis]
MVEVLDITENEKEAHLRFIKKYGNDLYIERKISPGSQFKKTYFPTLVNQREQFRFTAEDMDVAVTSLNGNKAVCAKIFQDSIPMLNHIYTSTHMHISTSLHLNIRLSGK